MTPNADLRVVHLAMSPRLAELVKRTVLDRATSTQRIVDEALAADSANDPDTYTDEEYREDLAATAALLRAVVDEIDGQLAPAPMPVTVISAEGVTPGVLNADDSITVPAPEPATKRVARKMAKAGAKAAA